MAMTAEEAAAEQLAAVRARVEREAGYAEERVATRRRYDRMLVEVEAWTPPTSEHIALRDLMRSQLVESIDVDCRDYHTDPPTVLPPNEYLAREREKAAAEIARCERSYAEELERCRKANAWIDALYDSLAATPTEAPEK